MEKDTFYCPYCKDRGNITYSFLAVYKITISKSGVKTGNLVGFKCVFCDNVIDSGRIKIIGINS
jgi:hypothetical protein